MKSYLQDSFWAHLFGIALVEVGKYSDTDWRKNREYIRFRAKKKKRNAFLRDEGAARKKNLQSARIFGNNFVAGAYARARAHDAFRARTKKKKKENEEQSLYFPRKKRQRAQRRFKAERARSLLAELREEEEDKEAHLWHPEEGEKIERARSSGRKEIRIFFC